MTRPASAPVSVPAIAGLVPLLLVCLASCGQVPTKPVASPPEVVVKTVAAEDLPHEKTFVGRSVTEQTVNFQARITGPLLERPYKQGGLVKAGDVLFKIDPAEYQADLESALARQAQSEAKLAQAELDVKRIEPLAQAGAAPQQELDDARTSLLSAQADLRAAKATVTTSRLNLSYTVITAPFAGRVSRANADIGALISPQSGTLATLDQVDPIAIDFPVSEQEILAYRKKLSAGQIASPSVDRFVVRATLQDGTPVSGEGAIEFGDIRFRPDTATGLIRAKLPNPNGDLLPGQFLRVQLVGVVIKNAIMLPQKAILQGPTGATVFVVKPDGTAESRTVVLGPWIGERWQIEQGLKSGEQVVVDGIQKVKPGTKVTIVSALAPGSATAATAAAAPAAAAAH